MVRKYVVLQGKDGKDVGAKPTKAKLGQKNAFYYDEQVSSPLPITAILDSATHLQVLAKLRANMNGQSALAAALSCHIIPQPCMPMQLKCWREPGKDVSTDDITPPPPPSSRASSIADSTTLEDQGTG